MGSDFTQVVDILMQNGYILELRGGYVVDCNDWNEDGAFQFPKNFYDFDVLKEWVKENCDGGSVLL